MKKANNQPRRFDTISEAHAAFGFPRPRHPLISLLNSEQTVMPGVIPPHHHVLHFYKVSYRPDLSPRLKYGQGYYDFTEGGLLFAAPNQVIGNEEDKPATTCSRYTLLIHPDFLWNYPLARKIRQFGFFSYDTNEALHLSATEKETILSVFRIIDEELNGRIDEFSQDVLVAQLELLFSYAQRFYRRQFITRKTAGNDLLQKMEALLDAYFEDGTALKNGLPTVQYLAAQLHLSPSYLSDMLRALSGMNAQQHIHEKLIEKAKEQLSATNLSVSEVAYALGFEHPQSFSKLFKTKTNLSPVDFRRSFN